MATKKEDLLKIITSFIGADNELAIKEAEHQIVVFKAILEKEINTYKQLCNKSDEIKNDDLIDPKKDDLNNSIIKAIEKFVEKQEKKKIAKEKSEKENLVAKKKLLKKFSELIKNKEKLAELAGGIKEIRNEWNSIGDIPQNYQQEVQKEFSKLNETFNYNFNIYKELKENDLKRNFSLKNQVIHQLKELDKIKDIGKLKIELKILQNKWEDIGPTFKEHWEEIKKEYWNLIHKIQKKINEHFIKLKTNLKENLEAKKLLIKKSKELTENLDGEFKDWEKTAQKFRDLQEEWKKVGPVSKKINDDIWNEFRSYSNIFFDKRKDHFDIEKKKWNANAEKKQLIVDKAKAYVDNIVNDSNPKLIKNLQEDWKKIGHAGKYAEQKLWKKFRTHCDAFFEEKNKNKKQIIESENAHLKAKKELLNKFEKENQTDFNSLNELIEEFQKIGEVPKKSSLQIMKSFEKIINHKIDNNNFTSEQKHQLKKAIKSSLLNNSSDPEKVYINEKSRINKLINNALKETAQLENNLSFFANAKGSKMLDDFKHKIDNQKKQIENWREELKKLHQAYNQK